MSHIVNTVLYQDFLAVLLLYISLVMRQSSGWACSADDKKKGTPHTPYPLVVSGHSTPAILVNSHSGSGDRNTADSCVKKINCMGTILATASRVLLCTQCEEEPYIAAVILPRDCV